MSEIENARQNLAEAQQRLKKIDDDVCKEFSYGEKTDADLKLARATADEAVAKAELELVTAQLEACDKNGQSREILERKLTISMTRWEISVKGMDVATKRAAAKLDECLLHSTGKRDSREQTGAASSLADDSENLSARKKSRIIPVSEVKVKRDPPHGGWQWCGDDGVFVDFSEELSTDMDERFEKMEYLFTSEIQGQLYRLDLKQMVQTRAAGEGRGDSRKRDLRRLCKEQEIPPTWRNQTEPVEIFPVLPHEVDFDKARNVLFNSGDVATLNASSFDIHSVRRVQNQLAYERFITERRILIKSRGAGRSAASRSPPLPCYSDAVPVREESLASAG